MPERFKRQILAHVSHPSYRPQRILAMAESLGVTDEDSEAFEQAVEEIIDAGAVVCGSSEAIALPPPGPEMTGTFRRHQRGFGFLVPDTPNSHGDLFVPAGHTGTALTGDLVRAEVIHRRSRSKEGSGRSPYTGKIVEVLQRGRTHFVGTLEKRGRMHYVAPDGKALEDLIQVRDPRAKHARIGDKVVVELTRYPEDGYLAEGVITEVLGEAGEPDVETQAVCRAYDLPDSFPEAVLEDTRRVIAARGPDLAQTSDDRTDLRETYILTIDPPDAQDFDDAISLESTDDGVELGVHIADVATFVTPGTPLDEEARERGNSTYLPRHVVPMLPEVLSNGLCSLQPGVPRLCKSAFMTYDTKGKVTRTRFARTIIQSNHRLTYLEAQALIDGDQKLARTHARFDAPYTDQLLDALKQIDELARRIRKRRVRDGMISLDLPEAVLVFDDDGRVVDAEPEDDAFTHQIIEACMVEANEAVARVFADLNVPGIRRVHPEPAANDLSDLRSFARVAGHNIPARPSREELQDLLNRVRGKPAARAVHFAVLKTLTKATYGPDLIGHFALASEHYTHFTSPIRRYPDLVVHRALDVLLKHLPKSGRIPDGAKARKRFAADLQNDPGLPDIDALRQLGAHCSATERKSEAAERELRAFLVLQLLSEKIGEEFAGTVTGVTGFGIFVQIDKYVVEGLIGLEDLPGAPRDRWQLSEKTGSLVARRSGHRLTIGDQLKVRINAIDLARRQMQLLIASSHAGESPRRKGSGRSRRGKEK
ncbi:MAG: VacB/RNase II family 3'-5' exoribonuclease [Phycisphaerae bacterium]|nr:VacB/RNase II family 3'-5' exoribonuclease [Phycisphaerae bacterium]